MEKDYFKKALSKNSEKEFKFIISDMNPSEKSIQFILNYSKSLSVKLSEKAGILYLNLN